MATLTNGTETIETGTASTVWVGIVNAAIQILDTLRGTVGSGSARYESGQGGWAPTIDGANTTFTLPAAYLAASILQVYVNGMLQPNSTITQTTPASGIFDFATAPLTGALVEVIAVLP